MFAHKTVADPGRRDPGPPLFFDQNEARRAEKKCFGDHPPPLTSGSVWPSAPPTPTYLKVWIRDCTASLNNGAYFQTRSIVELHFSSLKIKQLRRFGRFYLFRVSKSTRSPKRMQLSLIVGITFGFWLISDIPISGWSRFFFLFILLQVKTQKRKRKFHEINWKKKK